MGRRLLSHTDAEPCAVHRQSGPREPSCARYEDRRGRGKRPVLDDLPEGYQVAVENSAIVYDDGEGTVSTIVCNWFGAGNAGLADPNNDSSIQSYANIYDQNWLMKGNIMIAPASSAWTP